MYRSGRVRAPQYITIWRFTPMWKACSTMLLIGAKPVPLATNTIGLSLSSRRKEGAERAFEAQDVALFHLVEHVLGEGAVRHIAHVQLDVRIVFRGVAHGISAALAVAHDDFQVLAGENCSRSFAGRDR
jgi:hypothetical protein